MAGTGDTVAATSEVMDLNLRGTAEWLPSKTEVITTTALCIQRGSTLLGAPSMHTNHLATPHHSLKKKNYLRACIHYTLLGLKSAITYRLPRLGENYCHSKGCYMSLFLVGAPYKEQKY